MEINVETLYKITLEEVHTVLCNEEGRPIN